MNGKRYNLPLEAWQTECIDDWLRVNRIGTGDRIFLIAVPLVKEAKLEIVGWSGQEAHDAYKAFLEAMKQHYPGYAELRKVNANTSQDAS